VILQGIGTPREVEWFKSASWLRAGHPGGCAGVVLDGRSMVEPMMTPEDASLRALALLEAASLAQAYARVMGLSVIMGLGQPSRKKYGRRNRRGWKERW